MLTFLGLIFGKLISGLPFLLQFLDKKNDRAHELAMSALEHKAHADESVARVKELEAQVEALKATAQIVHEQAGDKAFQTALDNARPMALAVENPRTWRDFFLDVPTVFINAWNAATRPYIAWAVATVYVGIAALQVYAILAKPDLIPQVTAVASLATIDTLGGAFGLVVGHVFGERGWRKVFPTAQDQ